MTYLLDTHTLIWVSRGEGRLGPQSQAIFDDPSSVLLVSAVTAWEIATKVRLGKLPEAEALEADFVALMAKAGFVLIPLSAEEALHSGRLGGAHRDPWDRMIAAQALLRDIAIISKDTQLDLFDVQRIW